MQPGGWARHHSRRGACQPSSRSYVGAMRPERLTLKAQEALQGAQAEARRRDHQAVDVEHLVLALLAQPEGVAAPILEKIGVEPSLLASRVEDELRAIPSSCASSARTRCSTSTAWWSRRRASACAPWSASCALTVSFSGRMPAT